MCISMANTLSPQCSRTWCQHLALTKLHQWFLWGQDQEQEELDTIVIMSGKKFLHVFWKLKKYFLVMLSKLSTTELMWGASWMVLILLLGGSSLMLLHVKAKTSTDLNRSIFSGVKWLTNLVLRLQLATPQKYFTNVECSLG